MWRVDEAIAPAALCVLLPGVLAPAAAHPPVASATAACAVLKRVAVRQHFAVGSPGPEAHWWCDTSVVQPAYFTIGLHVSAPEPPGWVGGDLVGWYAVRRRDGRVFLWNIGNDDRGRPAATR